LTAAWADDPPVVVRTVTTDGKPAANARVWVYEYRDSAEEQAEPKPLVTDADGKVNLPPAGDSRKSQVVFARDTDGHIGSEFVGNWRHDSDSVSKLVLVATAERTGRVTGPDGKPVAGAVVTPQSFSLADETRRASAGLPYGIMLPLWEQKRLAAKTDADGRFKLLTTASDYRPYFRVKADGFGETKWSAPATGDLGVKLYATGSVTVAAAGADAATLKGVQVQLNPKDSAEPRADAAGVQVVKWASGKFDAAGRVTIADVAPGKYEITVQLDAKLPAVFEPGQSVEVTAGKTTEAAAKFGPAAKATGKITDPDTGKGIPGAFVNVTVGDGQSSQPKQWLYAQTDADGVFAVHGPAGWYRFFLNTPPDGYVLPPRNPRGEDPVKPVKMEVGKSHEFPAYQLMRAVSFAGVVVNADGKPVKGATVQNYNFDNPFAGKVVSDTDGKFTLKNLPPDDAIAPRVRLGTAVNVPQTFELSKTTGPEKIEISEANAAGLKGRVTDGVGKPIAGAKVSLVHGIQGVGRHAQYGTSRQVETNTTDADGRYAFAGYWPKDRYGVQVKAAGYADGEAKDVFGDAGQVREFPVIKLTRANLTVTGAVVGPDGKPVAGAEVFQVDGPTRTTAKSATDGTFTLTGFRDTAGFVFAKKGGFRLAAVPVFPAKPDRVTVRLIAADAPPPPPPPQVSAEHKAALDKLTKHLLTRLWDTREKLGYGITAVDRMAQLDPDTAKKWAAAEKERTDGKLDYTKRVDNAGARKRLLELARTDIDEAVAAITAMSAYDGFFEATRVGRELLATDKAKALRLAEEAVQKARQRELPDKVWSLADAGALAAEAGGAGGKKILYEAAELAAKLTSDENGRNGMNVGMVAARLAPHDLPKAEELLSILKAPGDYNRFLSATAARLAPTDFARAKGLLDKFKPENGSYPRIARLQVAIAVAAKKPDEALELVNGINDMPDRVQGLVRLAVAFVKTDKPRAMKTIDATFDLMERNPEAFNSWSNFGGRGGFVVLTAAHAAQIGHPDAVTLTARALSLRTGDDPYSPESRNEHIVNFAAVLALSDPAAARHVLAGIAPPDEFVNKALSSRRDWLFALALADPERAVQLVDKLIDRAVAGRGQSALSGSGLSELSIILLADDKLKELAGWASLPFGRDYD
jgi:protocatechuate 3,4-dioxygenase beta subunit